MSFRHKLRLEWRESKLSYIQLPKSFKRQVQVTAWVQSWLELSSDFEWNPVLIEGHDRGIKEQILYSSSKARIVAGTEAKAFKYVPLNLVDCRKQSREMESGP